MPEIDLNALPGLLRSLRTRTGRTQVDVAAAAGVPQANLSRWESGKVRPSLESLVAVLNALSLDFRDLQEALDEAAGREAARRERELGYYPSAFGRPARIGDPTLTLLADIDRRVSWLEQAFRMAGLLGPKAAADEQAKAETADGEVLKAERTEAGD